ncbi:hypothetical protein B0H11DRAFT_1919095 [Mycena galericulata]|nr:hypothetical protein B0H11DRAFT_1919095 [Mycena galericulata]
MYCTLQTGLMRKNCKCSKKASDVQKIDRLKKKGHRSMRRLQEKASVLVLDQVPGGSEKPVWMECKCIDPIESPACHESRAIRGLEWAYVWYFYQMWGHNVPTSISRLVSLGLSKAEAEDKVAQWLKSRVDNILAGKEQAELDWYSETVGLESPDEIISEEVTVLRHLLNINHSFGPNQKSDVDSELEGAIRPDDLGNLEKLRSTRKHPIRWEFALVKLEKGAGIDVLITAWFDAFHELRVEFLMAARLDALQKRLVEIEEGKEEAEKAKEEEQEQEK